MLNSLITSKTRLRVLLKFFIRAANKGHLNSLASEFGESTNGVRKELNKLKDAGYLISNKEQNKPEDCESFKCNENVLLWVINKLTIVWSG